MKKALKIGAIVFVLLIGFIAAAPFIFKDEIRKAVDKQIENNVNATVSLGDFGITFFRNFPNLTISLSDFSVVGKDEFNGDTLMDVRNFRIVLNLASVISGDEYQIRKIILDEPRIHAKILKNGKTNWDIMIADSAATDSVPEDSAATPFALELTQYSIQNGYVEYDDRESDMYVELVNLNHSGKGDFSEKLFNLRTTTAADEFTYEMEGSKYLNKARLDVELNAAMDLENEKYTLEDNSITLNDLTLFLSGYIQYKGADMEMDLSLGTNENKFSDILSMVPGVYTADFGDMETDGSFSMSGSVKGMYTETLMPGFDITLKVDDGYLKYPDLPTAISKISFDLNAKASTGDYADLVVSFPSFHAELGNNPIDAKLNLKGIMGDNMDIDASVKAAIDLAGIGTMVPLEGNELKGKFTANVNAKGIYNEAKGSFPVVNADLSLENGYVKSPDFPKAMEKMGLKANLKNQNGSLAETTFELSQFHTEIDGEPLDITMKVVNFDDPAYDLFMKGSLDLEKISKIFPVEGTVMSGKMAGEIKTSGVMSDVDAGRYMNLPTSGNVTMTNLKYSDGDFPQGIHIVEGALSFSPMELTIDKFKGYLGHSAIALGGSLSNYLAWTFLENEVIHGDMWLNSKTFDVNEWMTADEPEAGSATPAPTAAPAEGEEMVVYPIPKTIDFRFSTKMEKVLYDNLTLENLSGTVSMEDGEIILEGLTFGMLGGQFDMFGKYSTQNPDQPEYAMNFNVANLDVQKTYEAFESVQSLAPAAKYVTGKFNSGFTMRGLLNSDMTPDMASISSFGDLQLLNSKVSNLPLLRKVAEKTKVADLKEIVMKDTKIMFEIKDGRIFVEPFEVQAGKTEMLVEGSNGIDGTMDYDLNMDIPAGAAGAAAIGALSSLTKKSLGSADQINVIVGVGGTFDKPQITSVRMAGDNDPGDMAKDLIDDKIDDAKQQAQQEIDKQKEQLQNQAQEQIDKAKAEAEKKKAEAEALAKAEAAKRKAALEAKKKAEEERLKKELEEKKKKAAEDAKKNLPDIKGKLPLGKGK